MKLQTHVNVLLMNLGVEGVGGAVELLILVLK